jgi:hypothetical protein
MMRRNLRLPLTFMISFLARFKDLEVDSDNSYRSDDPSGKPL